METYIVIFFNLLLTVAAAFIYGCFSSMLDVFMDEGHILHRYFNWLKRNRDEGLKLGHLSEPMGLCPICMNVWLGVPAFILLWFVLNGPMLLTYSGWWFPVFGILSHFFLRYVDQYR